MALVEVDRDSPLPDKQRHCTTGGFFQARDEVDANRVVVIQPELDANGARVAPDAVDRLFHHLAVRPGRMGLNNNLRKILNQPA